MGWYEDRFTESPGLLRTDCQACSRPMWMPPSKSGKYKTCGGECAKQRYAAITAQQRPTTTRPTTRRWNCKACSAPQTGAKGLFCNIACLKTYRASRTEALKQDRTRDCLHCGAAFQAKKSQLDAGRGKWCSLRCAYDSGALAHISSPKNVSFANERRLELIASGAIQYARGPEHHAWQADRQAILMLRKQRDRDQTRRYRAANPQKVREFTKRRNGRKLGRLPKGTVARIGELQKWRCVVCKVNIKSAFHVDHIEPLARGGVHRPKNIQLLCPTCNVRKSAKDPLDFMQSRGFLL